MSDIKQAVQEKYGEAARQARAGAKADCACDTSGCCSAITSNLYPEDEAMTVPVGARLASLGCGNPTALAELKPGEVVLDLGAGGGIDVLLSARRVGPTGKAYGLDMTDEMLELARENQQKAGLTNVEFLKGEIEQIPLPDNSVDVVISNCVINLSADKDQVLREAFRVLKPGGRFAVSDIVARSAVPESIRGNRESWVACMAGALEEDSYRARLTATGFEQVDVEPTRIHDAHFMSAFVRAQKPVNHRACLLRVNVLRLAGCGKKRRHAAGGFTRRRRHPSR